MFFAHRSAISLGLRAAARSRRMLGVAGLSLVTAVGACQVPAVASASPAFAAVESRSWESGGSAMVCGPAAARGGYALRCVRRLPFPLITCTDADSPGAASDSHSGLRE